MALHPIHRQVNGRKPRILLQITCGYDNLYMLDEIYEHNPHVRHPVNEGLDSTWVYQMALQRVDRLRAAGYNVALEVKVRSLT